MMARAPARLGSPTAASQPSSCCASCLPDTAVFTERRYKVGPYVALEAGERRRSREEERGGEEKETWQSRGRRRTEPPTQDRQNTRPGIFVSTVTRFLLALLAAVSKALRSRRQRCAKKMRSLPSEEYHVPAFDATRVVSDMMQVLAWVLLL